MQISHKKDTSLNVMSNEFVLHVLCIESSVFQGAVSQKQLVLYVSQMTLFKIPCVTQLETFTAMFTNPISNLRISIFSRLSYHFPQIQHRSKTTLITFIILKGPLRHISCFIISHILLNMLKYGGWIFNIQYIDTILIVTMTPLPLCMMVFIPK